MTQARERLEQLARLHAIELSYLDIEGHTHTASDAALHHILSHMGVPVGSEAEVEASLATRRRELAQRRLEPVLVFWDDAPPAFVVRVPEDTLGGRYRIELGFEQGTSLGLEGALSTLRVIEAFEVDGRTYVDLEVRIPERMPYGYHRLSLELDDGRHDALVLTPPMKAFQPDIEKMWGLFAPTYALRGRRSLGAGGLGELEALVDLATEAGAQMVGTLPLMAAYLDEHFQPSPYVPVSKLFWNEMFLDLHQLARTQGSEAARLALADPSFEEEMAALREQPIVDYREQARMHRSVLEILAAEVFESGSSLRAELDAWLVKTPRAADYARFRAVNEKLRTPWPTWPERMRDGRLEVGDYEESAFRYHLYAQWRMDQQLARLGTSARRSGGGLYLDLPLGVHPDGYDAWRERGVFLDGVNAGAPPDALGPDGQDWGFRPLDPEGLRKTGYRYLIDCIRAQVRHAGALRVDHVMGLHRIFCVPWHMGGSQGVYVRHRPDEIWAILTLESRRHGAMIVGEDLGTVPDEVREAMDRHEIQRMYVLQFEMEPNRQHALHPVPGNVVASLNTHDTPSFAGFWEHRDIEDRQALGRTDDGATAWAKGERGALQNAVVDHLRDRGLLGERPSLQDIFLAVTRFLSESPARGGLVNLEDLWLEADPQNVPGTMDHERPNWRKKLAHLLEEVPRVDSVRAAFGVLGEHRNLH